MSRKPLPQDDLNEIISRIQTSAFIVVVGGLLLLSLASTFGDEISRTFVLGTLAIVFILAGGLFGLMSMYHISHTHLPEEPDEEEIAEAVQPAVPLRRMRQSRGFLGLFATGNLESPD